MPIQINEGDGGKFLTVHVSGKLVKGDYEHFVPEFERLVQQHGKLRVLFDLAGFQGLEAAALWEEIKFDAKHLADIERCAMVGDKQWQHVMTALCRPFIKVKIKYFDQTDAVKARQWWGKRRLRFETQSGFKAVAADVRRFCKPCGLSLVTSAATRF